MRLNFFVVVLRLAMQAYVSLKGLKLANSK